MLRKPKYYSSVCFRVIPTYVHTYILPFTAALHNYVNGLILMCHNQLMCFPFSPANLRNCLKDWKANKSPTLLKLVRSIATTKHVMYIDRTCGWCTLCKHCTQFLKFIQFLGTSKTYKKRYYLSQCFSPFAEVSITYT